MHLGTSAAASGQCAVAALTRWDVLERTLGGVRATAEQVPGERLERAVDGRPAREAG